MGREISCSCLRADVSQNSKSVGVVSSKGRRRAARNEKSPKNKDRIDREEEWMGRETTKNMCRKMKKNILSRSRSLALSLSLSGVLVQSAQPRAGSLRLFIHPALFVPIPFPWVTPAIFGSLSLSHFGVCYTRLPILSNCTRLTCYVPPCYSISVPTQPTHTGIASEH